MNPWLFSTIMYVELLFVLVIVQKCMKMYKKCSQIYIYRDKITK